MNPISFVFGTFIVNPIVTIVAGIYYGLTLLHIPSPLGFSIILLTIVIRFILYPFTSAQLKTAKKMQTIAPHLTNLKTKHKDDAKKLQAETMKLYKEHGVNPAAGCLPLLVQLPIIWGLYYVLQQIVNANSKHVISFVNHAVYISAFQIHHAWNSNFFGLPLGQAPSHLLSTVGFGVLLVPLLTAAFQFFQSKMMIPAASNKPVVVTEKKKDDDFATAFQTQSLFIFPLMIGFFSWSLPLGLSFYWNTFTIFGIIQQYTIGGLGGVEDWIKKIKKYGR